MIDKTIVIELLREGYSVNAVAQKLGIKRAYVYNIVSRSGFRLAELQSEGKAHRVHAVTGRFYEGEIRCGDVYASPENGGGNNGPFVWGLADGGAIELRSYSQSPTTCHVVSEAQLRSVWRLIRPNPAGTLICPRLKSEMAA